VVVDAVELPSGLVVADPLGRLRRFCQAEYSYCDGIPQGDPNRLEAGFALVSVPVFCGRLVERIVATSPLHDWDTHLSILITLRSVCTTDREGHIHWEERWRQKSP
jgi:hypothetical protein